MVLQVGDVVFHQKLQRDGGVVADLAFHAKRVPGSILDDMGEVPIVGGPQVDEFLPVSAAVVLAADPLVLFVLGKGESLGELGANEALVIVRRGVDQVPDNFLDRPPIRRGLCRHDVIRQSSKSRLG